jgi:outer dense fiber protein 2
MELMDRERELAELRSQVVAQREESVAMGNLQESLETTRGHLQKQLRSKEADCNRMAVQIRVCLRFFFTFVQRLPSPITRWL